MTIAAAGAGHAATSASFSLTPAAADGKDHFILLWVTSESTTQWATAISGSNIAWDAAPRVAHQVFTVNGVSQAVFTGKVTSTSAATQTVTLNSGSPTLRIAWQEFSTTAGYASITLDASGTIDVLSSGKMPPATSTGTARTYGGYVYDNGTGAAGSTAGFTYYVDPNGNQLAYNTSCGSGLQQPDIGDTSDGTSGIAVLLYEAVTAYAGAASLSGSGTLGASWALAGSAPLSGSGTVTPAAAASVLAAGALNGAGYLAAGSDVFMPGAGAAALAGSGDLGVTRLVTWRQGVPLSGTGTVAATETGLSLESVPLSGTGSLFAAPAAALEFTAGLYGAGFFSIPQVAGGLVNGVGGAAVPQALPGSSQVAVAPQGSSNWQWIGTLGEVTALTYSYTCPGGPDKMQMTLMVPAAYRTQMFNPGWQVKIIRGGHQVWYGKLDEPQPSAQGWTLTAEGAGNFGQDYVAYYSVNDVWPQGEPDEIISRAIIRGLPWSSPGLGSSPYFSQFWFGQAQDPGSVTVTAFLNLICTRGGLTWYVSSQPGGSYGGNNLSVFPLPTVPNRLLVATTPVARTLAGYYNSIFIRYEQSADNTATNTAAAYNVVLAQNAASVAAHGPLETYLDLSNAGVLTGSQAQQVGLNLLQLYEAATYAGPFTASYGQLLNMGGAPVDPGTDQCGNRVRMILSDQGLGGEVVPGPVDWTVGSYSWDDFQQVATISPFVELDQSLSGLAQMISTTMTPLAVSGA